MRKGAYVVSDDENPEVLVIGTGSELELALGAAKEAREAGRRVRVISMPSTELFLKQSTEYRDSVLIPSVKARVSVEAASTYGWRELLGDKGVAVGIDRFGASGPAGDVQVDLGMTVDHVSAAIDQTLSDQTK